MSRIFFAILYWVVICLVAPPVAAWEGRVVRVVDGDTLVVAPDGVTSAEFPGVSVRLYGIDAPELNRPGGAEAKAALEGLAGAGDTVRVLSMESDRYDRLVAVVSGSRGILNVEQLRTGYAQVDERYCRASFCREWRRVQAAPRWAPKAGSAF